MLDGVAGVLQNLAAVSEETRKEIKEEGGLATLNAALKDHKKNGKLKKELSGALSNLKNQTADKFKRTPSPFSRRKARPFRSPR